ncbi:UDP-N-acetylglucosamine 2-epimerase [Azospirillum thermophilum]|uniref:UDP-N-acetylglucosamine 2-epimerase (Hydrolyzing) n=1 Tax=Azospirillum thermophilum TaxID=2202148 RepID=A0A2S2D0N1_9PROT|nr:UDP-N-acetylglucosamine 2-epimerase [Azospirillum thermophilum]AWK90248.1 UDP-N-acetylglucosamine 2-epimerase (hydrolyzing) [Azospirillum thermophilum]
MTRRICVFTGGRAEYGHLRGLMRHLDADPGVTLRILVSGMHLAAEFGHTVDVIEADGFTIAARVEMLLSGDTPSATCASMGLGLIRFADALDRLRPDLLVVLGDRFEALAAAQAALVLGIPIAHLHGGEASEGVLDEAFRHAITKLAHLHFAAAEPYRQRIIQLGEAPDRVFTVGAPGLDGVGDGPPMDRTELEEELGFRLGPVNFLVTYHPVTLGGRPPEAAAAALFDALDRFPHAHVIVTRANADSGGRAINTAIDRFAADRPGRVFATASLGQRRYLSAMYHADVVIGNSSSGLIEAPVVGRPTVNLGDRQKGRLRAPSVIDCTEEAGAIAAAVERALGPEMRAVSARRESPYGRGGAAARIAGILARFPLDGLLHKSFHDLPAAGPAQEAVPS